ncbi:hypothetical protein OUZ56_026412 [Daphnia magna]|uniref:Uncharacterized protein n=1 Tax=Daphnia magna TaxID=35525 RepID=A0ABQ9ZLP4_9CRUS|nr:hypothetical protein OUZ56_026412 [Daphnia magna]
MAALNYSSHLAAIRVLDLKKSSQLSAVGNCPLSHAHAPFWPVGRSGTLSERCFTGVTIKRARSTVTVLEERPCAWLVVWNHKS